jgi:hypothetical protein
MTRAPTGADAWDLLDAACEFQQDGTGALVERARAIRREQIGMPMFNLILAFSITLPGDSVGDYRQVIPADAESHRSFVTVHRVGPKVYLEVLAGSEMILARGSGSQVMVRWERFGNTIALRRITPLATYDSAYDRWERAAGRDAAPVVASFPIAAIGPSGAMVLDVTSLARNELPIFSYPKASTPDEAKRSFIVRAAAYPENVVIESVVTSSTPATNQYSQPTISSKREQWHFVRLPQQLMRPRRFDERVGFFPARYAALTSEHPRYDGIYNLPWEAERDNIIRYRLEKKDPAAPVSEPVKPIVFYLEPGTPAKWRRWIKAGVEAWQPAFEAAGFKNAIVARDAPSDSIAAMDDVRNSIVRWIEEPAISARAHSGASASTVVDERTGEILKCDIVGLGSAKVNTVRDWYFTQSSPLDPRAQALPFPDTLLGGLLQYVVEHEVGHCLGLIDGAYGKLTYPVDSLRSRSWLQRMGHTPSVMNYARYNYVAQPEDSIPPHLLFQRVGPADVYQIKWGYLPVPQARLADDEAPMLEQLIRAQDNDWTYRWAGPGDELTERLPYTADAVDDADPIRSTALGLKNLRRVMTILPRAALRPGSDNRDLESLYGQVLAQRVKELSRVVDLIGGATVYYKAGHQTGAVFTPIPAARQREAMRFLDSAGFATPTWMIAPEVTSRFEPSGLASRLIGMQVEMLKRLIEARRFHRLVEQEIAAATTRERSYPLAEVLTDIRRSVWSELSGTRVEIDPVRQGLQRTFVQLAHAAIAALPEVPTRPSHNPGPSMKPPPTFSAQEQALLRAQLISLRSAIATALPRAIEAGTKAHLDASLADIQEALAPAVRQRK